MPAQGLEGAGLSDAQTVWTAAVEGAEFPLEHALGASNAVPGPPLRRPRSSTSPTPPAAARSLYADHPLQRRFRDIHALTQHFLVKADSLTTAGAVLAGQEINVPVF